MDDENLPPSKHRQILHQRKIAKPLMEKRRRERINNCLDQLKSLLTEVTKKDEEEENSYRSKLEKADILEMTVNYLKSVKRRKISGANSTSADPAASIHSRYVAGFRECAEEVAKYLEKADGLHPETQSTILQHLAKRLQHSVATNHQKQTNFFIRTTSSSSSPQLILPPPPSTGAEARGLVVQSPPFVSGSVNPASASVVSYPIQLLPAKLPTGETVFVVASANDLLRPHQMAPLLFNEKQPNTGGRRHVIDDTTNQMQSGDGRTGMNSYEAISPAAASPLHLSPRDLQNSSRDDVLQSLPSWPSSTSFTSDQLQTTRYPHANCDSATNVDNIKTTIIGNLVFNNTASNPVTESKLPNSLLIEPSLFVIDNMGLPVPHVMADAVAARCRISGDQSHVWRPW